MVPPPELITEADMLSRLQAGEVTIAPLQVKWKASLLAKGPDATAIVTWGGKRFRFAAELKSRSIPKFLSEAVRQARLYAERSGDRPLVVVPYLAPERLEELEQAGVSGMDLCGNVLLNAPGSLFYLRTGAPNRFKETQSIRDVYRGTTSLVPRALLLQPNVRSLSHLQQFIRSRGAAITLSTISKALRRMEDDILIERRRAPRACFNRTKSFGNSRLPIADPKFAGVQQEPRVSIGKSSLIVLVRRKCRPFLRASLPPSVTPSWDVKTEWAFIVDLSPPSKTLWVPT